MLSSGRLRIRISPQRPQMIHSGTARSLSLSLTMALSSSTEDRSPHYPRTSHVPTAHLWGSGSAGRRTSDLHPQSPNILQFRISFSLPSSLAPSAHLHPRHSQSPNPHWRFSTRRPRVRARPRSCGAAPLTRMALICISRIHYAILPCIEQTQHNRTTAAGSEGGRMP